MNLNLLFLIAFLFFPSLSFAEESNATSVQLNLTHHVVGYLAAGLTIVAYIAAMSEDVIALRESLKIEQNISSKFPC